jgi:ankyrin repeat protein
MTRVNALLFKGLLTFCCLLISACASFSDYTTAANQGDMAFIDSYLAEGGAVDERDGMGYTALHRAAQSGRLAVVTRLLDAGANPNVEMGESRDNALIAAAGASTNSADMVAALLRSGGDPNQANAIGKTPLWAAVSMNNVEAARQLMDAGADPDTQVTGYTPLMLAAHNKYSELVRLLLVRGADVEAVSNGVVAGYNALYFGVERRNWNQKSGWQSATRLGPVAASHRGVNGVNEAFLHSEQQKVVDMLLAAGSDPNISGKWTPLTRAARQGADAGIVESLLLAGADVDKKTPDDYSALYLASGWNRDEQVGLLLAAGADVNLGNDNEFETALFNAANNGQVGPVKRLLAAGANVELADIEGFTPLYLASYEGYAEVVRLLLAAGAKTDTRNGKGDWSPLQTAAEQGHADVVRELVAAGADVNQRSKRGSTPVYFAAKSGKKAADDIIKMLAVAGADVNARCEGYYALHLAADKGYYDTVKILLSFGANPNLRDKDNDSALDIAMYHGYQKTTAYIQQYGGQTNSYKKSNSGDMFGKIFATVAIGAIAGGADIPIENSLDVMGAAVGDIWVDDGKGTRLAQMQQQVAQGTYQIKDPALRRLAETRVQLEQQNREIQQQVAAYNAEQKRRQEEQRAQMAIKKAQYAEQKATYQQRQQEAAIARQEAARAAEQARRDAEQRRRVQLAQQQAQQQQEAAQAQERDAAKRVAEAIAPKPRSGSINSGPMDTAEKADCDCEGTLTKQNFSVGSCQVASLQVAYEVSHFLGEPLVKGDYKWQSGGAEDDCLPSGFTVWLKIQNRDAFGYVEIDPAIPRAGQVSFSGTASSPNWDNFICGYQGGTRTSCFDAETAKTLYKQGRVVGFEVSHQ